MKLETQRLIIRDFNRNDVEALYGIKYDHQVLEYDPFKAYGVYFPCK